MGLIITSDQKKAFQKAKQIREELYQRVYAVRAKYENQFMKIDDSKKSIIKNSSASELTNLMDSHKITAIEIMFTFIERTCYIGIQNNYVTDEMFQDAINSAKICDSQRQRYPDKKCWRSGQGKEQCFPPFFGVPISIKESILFQGRRSYVGHVEKFNQIPSQHSLNMKLVLKMGFIPFVRTNVPQANKTFDTNNHIFGYSSNPWDTSRSCGGSSGGQGGIVASYCSPIGLGSDVAGSVRIPCEYTGLITLKPYRRYSTEGNANTGAYVAGLPLKAEICPLVKSVEDLIIFNEFMYNKKNYENIPKQILDPYLKLLPFRNQVFQRQNTYKIGYFIHLKNSVKCSKTTERAVLETVKILQNLGHKCQQIAIPETEQMLHLLMRLWFSNPNLETLKQLKKKERHIPEFQLAFILQKLPWFLKVILFLAIRKRQPRFSKLIQNFKPLDAKQYHFLMYENYVRRQRMIYDYLAKNQIDLIVCPTMFSPAIKKGDANKFTCTVIHPIIWNLLNYPVGCLPITTVQPHETQIQDYHHDFSQKVYKQNLKGSVGLPVGVQIASFPNKEEQILYVMSQIERQVKFNKTYINPAFSCER